MKWLPWLYRWELNFLWRICSWCVCPLWLVSEHKVALTKEILTKRVCRHKPSHQKMENEDFLIICSLEEHKLVDSCKHLQSQIMKKSKVISNTEIYCTMRFNILSIRMQTFVEMLDPVPEKKDPQPYWKHEQQQPFTRNTTRKDAGQIWPFTSPRTFSHVHEVDLRTQILKIVIQWYKMGYSCIFEFWS
jgi:hypothetical protein